MDKIGVPWFYGSLKYMPKIYYFDIETMNSLAFKTIDHVLT